MAGRATSIEASATQAEAAFQQGRWREAEAHYRALVAQTHVINYEYDEWLRRLADVYGRLGLGRLAAIVYLYLHDFPRARAQTPADELATLARLAEFEQRFVDAARQYEGAGLPVHAAVCFERGKATADAARLWQRLRGDARLAGHPYEAALVDYNVGATLARLDADAAESRRALIDCQRSLEAVADEFEQRGELERAFDCYQVLLELGRTTGQFENLAEGYLNCIRVLREDNLKFYVLQYYEDFVRLALERGELHAAATLFADAAGFAAAAGLPYDRHYRYRAALAWVRCADAYAAGNAPVEMVENALLAAASQFATERDFAKVRECFERLAGLELPERSRQRFARAASRYVGFAPSAHDAPGLPDYLKQQHAYASIWHADLLEWEDAGDPSATAAGIIGDLRYPNGIRRRALAIVLAVAAAGRDPRGDTPALRAELAEMLGHLQSYAALAPLEKLYRDGDPAVRAAAVRAVRFLYFKRSFAIVREALVAEAPEVRRAALASLAALHFPHALGPLARVFSESPDEAIRTVALSAIGKIQTIEAGELLLSAFRNETGELRNAAYLALANIDNADFLPILRQRRELEGDPKIRASLSELIRRAERA